MFYYLLLRFGGLTCLEQEQLTTALLPAGQLLNEFDVHHGDLRQHVGPIER